MQKIIEDWKKERDSIKRKLEEDNENIKIKKQKEEEKKDNEFLLEKNYITKLNNISGSEFWKYYCNYKPIKLSQVAPGDEFDIALGYLMILRTHHSISIMCEYFKDNINNLNHEWQEYYKEILTEGLKIEEDWLPEDQEIKK